MKKYFCGEGDQQRGHENLPLSTYEREIQPTGYIAEPGLVDAVNVALHLGQPLLLTGQPGTGKTQLASRLAWELRLEPVLKFDTKSTSEARDLFYSYDALGRFQATQADIDAIPPILDFIHWGALGKAVLYANSPERVKHLLRAEDIHSRMQRSVVLIDEVDKAPRDFPNDLLGELEGMFFRVPELGNETITANPAMKPIVVMTSNSEKNLPEAFLRRCIFYEIPFPEGEHLRRIVNSRLGARQIGEKLALSSAIDLLERLRSPEASLSKKPSTAEFLAWLRLLQQQEETLSITKMTDVALCTLVKSVEDQEKARKVIGSWIGK